MSANSASNFIATILAITISVTTAAATAHAQSNCANIPNLVHMKPSEDGKGIDVYSQEDNELKSNIHLSCMSQLASPLTSFVQAIIADLRAGKKLCAGQKLVLEGRQCEITKIVLP